MNTETRFGLNLDVIQAMSQSRVENYALPGLTSSLLGADAPGAGGVVRLFESSREHQEAITPHSHRFDFTCMVLRGGVRNRIWTRCKDGEPGDDFQESSLSYLGRIGQFEKKVGAVGRWNFRDHRYSEGQCYSMTADEVHSIYFQRDTLVLFFEGPNVSDVSIVIEPFVAGQAIPTLESKPWMFQRPRPPASIDAEARR